MLGVALIPASAWPASGVWLEPASGGTIGADVVLGRAAAAGSVLLGEVHNDPENHRWQLHVLAALHGRRPRMVIGLEAFPRAVQPVLDRWVAGELSEQAFLAAVRWPEIWGYDAALYMPLFHFARMHRLPLVALNVQRKLVARVAREGWSAVPAAEREGLGDPRPPGAAYRSFLAHSFALAPHARSSTAASKERGLARFIEAQLTWDRAMAEAMRDATSVYPGALMVAVAGRGHVDRGWGIAHQLDALGAPQPMILLAVAEADVPGIAPDLADAVFVLRPWPAAEER